MRRQCLTSVHMVRPPSKRASRSVSIVTVKMATTTVTALLDGRSRAATSSALALSVERTLLESSPLPRSLEAASPSL